MNILCFMWAYFKLIKIHHLNKLIYISKIPSSDQNSLAFSLNLFKENNCKFIYVHAFLSMSKMLNISLEKC